MEGVLVGVPRDGRAHDAARLERAGARASGCAAAASGGGGRDRARALERDRSHPGTLPAPPPEAPLMFAMMLLAVIESAGLMRRVEW